MFNKITFSILILSWFKECNKLRFSVSSEAKTKLIKANVSFVLWWILSWRWNYILLYYIVFLFMTTWLKSTPTIQELIISGSLVLVKNSSYQYRKMTDEHLVSTSNASKVWRYNTGKQEAFICNSYKINTNRSWIK